MLPFTREQFISVFAAYNDAVWPAQVLSYLLAAAMCLAVLRGRQGSGRFVAAGLAAMWAFTGIAYHGMHFSAINRAAGAFAALFVIQALFFVEAGVFRQRLQFGRVRGWRAVVGWALAGYAAVAYPAMPMFGIAPCPVAIFTFGLLLLSVSPPPWRLCVIPLLWSLIGGSAAMLLGVPQDWVLLVSGASLLLLPCGTPKKAAAAQQQRGAVWPAR
jgi:Family of unknown function (DUF6064)